MSAFEYTTTLAAPFAANETRILATAPSALTTAFTTNGAEYNITAQPTAIALTIVTGVPVNTATTVIKIPLPTVKNHSNGKSVGSAVPAALGAVLGVVIIGAVAIIYLITRRNKHSSSLADNPNDLDENFKGELELAMRPKNTQAGEYSSEELRRQLAGVRAELATFTAMIPTTVRDQSDYLRDLSLMNDSIRQAAMQISSSGAGHSARLVRSVICDSIWSHVFAKFDVHLDAITSQQFTAIERNLTSKGPGSAALWKAMTVSAIPGGDIETTSVAVQDELRRKLGQYVFAQESAANIVQTAAHLSRALAEDAKGYAVRKEPDGQSFTLVGPDEPSLI